MLTTPPLAVDAPPAARRAHYEATLATIAALIDGESDWIAAMATIASELHHAFAYFDWTGFYRATTATTLVVGPYQGGHGCLRIDVARGVCGKAARTRETQLVPDVELFPDHIACSSTTRSEIVVPIVTSSGRLLAVLDVDSNTAAAFGEIDRAALELLAQDLGRRFANTSLV